MSNGTRVIALCGVMWGALAAGSARADQVQPVSDAASTVNDRAAQADGVGEIVVTARQRSESLVDVPVAVTAISSSALVRANANDLTKIGELSPGVIVSNINSQGGGSIAIRGISSPANALGFEQSVSVSVDGVQTSNGYIASAGYFDLARVEVLKGPQALLFGKNNTAGVISLTTALPTADFFASIRSSYEFVADEVLVDAVVSGPIAPNLGYRVALRGRRMTGWLYNDARPIADNPFIPGIDQGIPGAGSRRVGDSEIAGRVTLAYNDGPIELTAKLTHNRVNNGGGGLLSQSVCQTVRPNIFGQYDPYGDCKADNHTAGSNPPPEVVTGNPYAPADGRSYGHTRVWSGVVNGQFDLGALALTSVTGYNHVSIDTFYPHDQTSLGQVFNYEETKLESISQELRALTDFDGPFNAMIGGYYQKQNLFLDYAPLINDADFNPANGVYLSFNRVGRMRAQTFSAFAQGILKIGSLEATAGLRWTKERKSYTTFNTYGFPATRWPTDKTISGRNSDSNLSPEATVAWHPAPRTTIYAAYRTGYKSGSFNMTTPIQPATVLRAMEFGPEKARGFEVGAKGSFLDSRLFIDVNLFKYKYTDLQVNALDPVLITFVTTNVGKLDQHGAELQTRFDATGNLKLRASLAWVHNRYHDYVGQCYGYTYPAGDTTSPAPQNCRFRSGTRSLEQDFEGRTPPRSPDWTGSGGFTYSASLGSAGVLEFYGDAFYSSSYNASETLPTSVQQPSFWRFNAGVTLQDADEHWELGLVGRNLTNKYYLLYASDNTGGSSVPLVEGKQRTAVARGREIVLQFSYKF